MIVYAALAPHPPLLIPDIGGDRLRDVQATVEGMRNLARKLVDSDPQTLVFITPHGNVFSDCLTALGEKRLHGDLTNFGSRLQISAANDLELLHEIALESAGRGISFVILDRQVALDNGLNPKLDHGILVPLFYLKEAGLKDIPVVAISIGFLSDLELYAFGQLVQKSAEKLGRRVALLASGDMSHRLLNEGPYDYHPDGPKFDALIRDKLTVANFNDLLKTPEKLRSNAGECGFRSIIIMAGCLDGSEVEGGVFSYQGPFGVGYLTAGFRPSGKQDSLLSELEKENQEQLQKRKENESVPVKWARQVLESYIRDRIIPPLPAKWAELKEGKAGAFVSLKKNGQLRGCIGTIQAACENLAEEIAANAVNAGTRDPRFLPVSNEELDKLTYSVDILGEAEPCEKKDLDPRRFGVIVSSGRRRGLLLPDLEGVDTVDQQLAIALQKGGIKPDEPYKIERFKVTRYN